MAGYVLCIALPCCYAIFESSTYRMRFLCRVSVPKTHGCRIKPQKNIFRLASGMENIRISLTFVGKYIMYAAQGDYFSNVITPCDGVFGKFLQRQDSGSGMSHVNYYQIQYTVLIEISFDVNRSFGSCFRCSCPMGTIEASKSECLSQKSS